MSFSDSNTVEQMILDACAANAWQYVPTAQLGRLPGEVMFKTVRQMMEAGA